MAESILTIFRRNALKLKETPCFHYKVGGRWVSYSWVEAEERVRRYSLGLSSLGVKSGSKVAIWSQTRVEWTLCDLAILACGAVVVPVYHTLHREQVSYILKNADVSVLIVEKKEQWNELKEQALPHLTKVIVIEGEGDQNLLSLEHLVSVGNGIPVNHYDEQLKQIQPEHHATYIYTSGTTGFPKGAVVTHKNILSECEGLQGVFRFQPNQICLLCLPLAHVVARAVQFYQMSEGFQMAYVSDLEQLGKSLEEVRPHFFLAVPRLLEKVLQKVQQKVHSLPSALQKMALWSQQLGLEVSELRQKRRSLGWWQWVEYQAAYWLGLRQLKKRLGGRIQFIISGGAPLSKEVAQFFHGHGILILEGYGLTETFAAVTVNRPDDFRFGTVGKPVPGVRIRMSPDGEICIKGDMVFSGYFQMPNETKEVFDEEGWFRTGDIGDFTKDGFLRITDRKKDIIVTSGGKNIAPQRIEELLKGSLYINQAFVYGDGRKFISALVTLNKESVLKSLEKKGIIVNGKSLASHQAVYQMIREEVDKANQQLASFETVKKFAILDAEFSIETGELTPSMKVKRKVVLQRYQDVLEQFYRE